MNELFESARSALLHGKDLVLCSILKAEGSAPRKGGARMLVFPDASIAGSIGGGDLEKYAIGKALEVYGTKESYTRLFHLDSSKGDEVSMVCGGDVTVRFEYIPETIASKELSSLFGMEENSPIVYIFGGGHVGKELCPVLEHVGFRVWVLDDRVEFASSSLHPKAEKTICCDYDHIGEYVEIRKDDYVCIMTHGHVADRTVLLEACRRKPSYIGCIGSRRKVAMTKEYLRENGIDEETIETIHSPIGIELYGDTPEEIAISIAAELIRHRAVVTGYAK